MFFKTNEGVFDFLKSNTHEVISNILLNINYKYVHVFCNKLFT